MEPPTHDELQAAYDAITAEGPGAPFTRALADLAVFDPLLRENTDLLVQAVIRDATAHPALSLLLTGAFTGALIKGLSLGMRIGMARAYNRRGAPQK